MAMHAILPVYESGSFIIVRSFTPTIDDMDDFMETFDNEATLSKYMGGRGKSWEEWCKLNNVDCWKLHDEKYLLIAIVSLSGFLKNLYNHHERTESSYFVRDIIKDSDGSYLDWFFDMVK
jgi:hypothetical protein